MVEHLWVVVAPKPDFLLGHVEQFMGQTGIGMAKVSAYMVHLSKVVEDGTFI